METSRNVILVPVDFGEASARALEIARALAVTLGAEVVALHVYFPPVVAYPAMPPTLVERMYTESEAAAQKALGELGAKHPDLRTILRQGDPVSEILEVITLERPMMVVMGTHGYRGLKRLFLGSVAERVIARSTAPVMTVHAPDHPA